MASATHTNSLSLIYTKTLTHTCTMRNRHKHTYSCLVSLNGYSAGTSLYSTAAHTLMERTQRHLHTSSGIWLSRKSHISLCNHRQLYIHTNHPHTHLSSAHTHGRWCPRRACVVTGPRVNSWSTQTSSTLFWSYSHPPACTYTQTHTLTQM